MATNHTLTGGIVVKERNPLGVVGLSIITGGIYFLYWYYAINKELAAAGEDVKPGIALLAITLGAVIIVPWIMSMHKTAERIKNVQQRAGVTSQMNPVLATVTLFTPIGIVWGPYAQQSMNSAWLQMTGTSTAPAGDAPAV
jgi:hypothetical protein